MNYSGIDAGVSERDGQILPPVHWPCNISSYHKLSLLGRGSISSVWRARVSVSVSERTVEVALKIIDLEGMSGDTEDGLLQEVQTMRLAAHPNLLPCHCSFLVVEDQPQLCLVTQFMDRGSCSRVMEVLRKAGRVDSCGGFSEAVIAYVVQGMCAGLTYLHRQGLIHRDVKAGNLLLARDGAVRLADFGVSGSSLQQMHRRDAKTAQTFVGTPCNMAPEVMDPAQFGGGYDSKADIWSLGITVLELAKGRAPYAVHSPMMVLKLTMDLLQDEVRAAPSVHSQQCFEHDRQAHRDGEPFSALFDLFVEQCLGKRPGLRPSADQLLAHSWLDSAARLAQGRADLTSLLCDPTLFADRDRDTDSFPDPPATERSDPRPLHHRPAVALPPSTSQANLTPPSASVSRSVHFSPAVLLKDQTPKPNPNLDLSEDSPPNPNPNPNPKFVPGTTWVFDSGEKGAGGGAEAETEGDLAEFLQSFEDEQATLTRSSPRDEAVASAVAVAVAVTETPSSPSAGLSLPPSSEDRAVAPTEAEAETASVDTTATVTVKATYGSNNDSSNLSPTKAPDSRSGVVVPGESPQEEPDRFGRRFDPRQPPEQGQPDLSCSTKDFLDDFENDVVRDES
eukprot:gene34079-44032_t